MKNRLEKHFITILGLIALWGVLLVGGCGETETGKALTDTVKKLIGEEVSKKGDEVKKQFDQVMNLGADKGKEGDENEAAGGSEKKSKEESGEEED